MRKIIIDSKQFQKLVKVLKEQDESQYYKISPEEYLELLKFASYNPKVTGIKKFGGKPLYITGKLKLTGSDNNMTSLGNVAVVDGDLDVSGVPIQTLGNVKVVGSLNISNTKIPNLKGVYVKGRVHDWGSPMWTMRVRREELRKMAEADLRREDGDWDLTNPRIDEEGLQANALFKYLVDEGDLEKMSEETTAEIKSKMEEYEDIQYRYKSMKGTASEEELESLEERTIELLNEIEELKSEGGDVYSLVPTGYQPYNKVYAFEVVGLKGREYMVGLYDDMYEAAVENQEQLLDDVGLEGLSSWLIEDNLDKQQIRDEMEEFYEEDIRENPEIYFNPGDYELTDEQEERKEQLENYIFQMEDLKTEKEEELENIEDEDIITNLERQIEEIEENIEKAQDELDSIVPDEEPTEEMIERKVERYTRLRDEKDWLKELGRDLKEYVDMKSVARDIVDHDGIGAMSSYDGRYNEVYITGPDGKRHNFVIIRTQ
jgi:hypothetical protein